MSLKNKCHSQRAVFTLLASVLLLFASICITSCSDRLKGDQTPNNPPQVNFVNIPPDGYKESFNDVIHWVGSDNDGQVEMFRYVVIKEELILAEGKTVTEVALELKQRPSYPPYEIYDTIIAGQALPDGWDTSATLENGSFVIFDSIIVDTIFVSTDTLIPTYLRVTIDEPQTSNIVAMSASLTNPVLEYVPQYVFLQAFDDQNASSDVVFLSILRNDFPPETDIVGVDPDRDYINAEIAGGVNTGIPIRWEGSDPDIEDTLFEYQWKFYGPYEYLDTLNNEYQELLDYYVKTVFVTNTAELFIWDTLDAENEYFVLVDSSYVCDTLTDTCYVEIEADTIYIDSLLPIQDSISQWGIYGYFDTLFDVTDEDFINDPVFNNVQVSSGGWITSNKDTLYDVFPDPVDPAGDTTRTMKFIFWIQARDAAKVVDLTPDYVAIKVIQPRYEREVLVIDFTDVSTARFNAPYKGNVGTGQSEYESDTAAYYWEKVIETWGIQKGLDFDLTPVYTSPGFTDRGSYNDYIFDKRKKYLTLRKMLQYKVIILYNDDIQSSGLLGLGGALTDWAKDIFTAIEAGVNVWLTMRAPLFGDYNAFPLVGANFVTASAPEYAEFFGVDPSFGMSYSGWGFHSYDGNLIRPHRRIEDFIGAISLDDSKWSNLDVDTLNLKRRYNWDYLNDLYSPYNITTGQYFLYDDTIPMSPTNPRIFKPADLHALPEVNWASRIYGTEGIYLYKSYYGLNHPLGFDYSFEGAPVAHRYNTGLYKTVHFCFTPLSINDEQMQPVINSVLDWLYPEDGVVTTPTSIRYPEAKVKVDMAQSRANYWNKFEADIDQEKAGAKPVGKKVTGLQ